MLLNWTSLTRLHQSPPESGLRPPPGLSPTEESRPVQPVRDLTSSAHRLSFCVNTVAALVWFVHLTLWDLFMQALPRHQVLISRGLMVQWFSPGPQTQQPGFCASEHVRLWEPCYHECHDSARCHCAWASAGSQGESRVSEGCCRMATVSSSGVSSSPIKASFVNWMDVPFFREGRAHRQPAWWNGMQPVTPMWSTDALLPWAPHVLCTWGCNVAKALPCSVQLSTRISKRTAQETRPGCSYWNHWLMKSIFWETLCWIEESGESH